jgi:hypothetical protein
MDTSLQSASTRRCTASSLSVLIGATVTVADGSSLFSTVSQRRRLHPHRAGPFMSPMSIRCSCSTTTRAFRCSFPPLHPIRLRYSDGFMRRTQRCSVAGVSCRPTGALALSCCGAAMGGWPMGRVGLLTSTRELLATHCATRLSTDILLAVATASCCSISAMLFAAAFRSLSMSWPPPKKRDAQTVDFLHSMPFQFLKSFLLVRRGWFAIKALQIGGGPSPLQPQLFEAVVTEQSSLGV